MRWWTFLLPASLWLRIVKRYSKGRPVNAGTVAYYAGPYRVIFDKPRED